MLTVLVFIIILGLLIFVHEFGHFAAARRNKIRVYEFGFGFPPRIFGIRIVRRNFTDELKKEKKWQFIWGKSTDEKEADKDPLEHKGTVYSINWIPLGGFVRIKGEDGDNKLDSDSFSAKSAWIRTKVLTAGVAMNLLLAWVLLAIVFILGAPEAIEDSNDRIKDYKIQISQVIKESPADEMGIKPGDEIIKCLDENEKCVNQFSKISQIQDYIFAHRGQEIVFEVKRGNEMMILKGVPRVNYPENEGALGIALVKTAIVRYPWHEAIIRGLTAVVDIFLLIIYTLFDIVKGIFVGEKVSVDVSGPVGIAFLAKQATQMGFIYVLQFAAILSINLAIINGFPFPALDGGRILFIIIEKIKGGPVSHRVENFFHAFGFFLLITLMIIVTIKDLFRFEIADKIGNIF